jgi:hypothetical protein
MKPLGFGFGVAVVLILAVATPAPAGDGPTIADVKEAWKARQEAHKSFRIEWVETVTVKAGSYSSFPGQPPGPHPPEDGKFTTHYSLAADGEKAAGTIESQLYSHAERGWNPFTLTAGSNGSEMTELRPFHRPGWGFALLRTGKDSLVSWPMAAFECLPVVQLYRPLGGGAFVATDFERVKLTGRAQKVGATTCAEVVIPPPAPANPTRSIWCDSARGYLPLREECRFPDKSVYAFEWGYRQDDERWVPTGWEMKQLEPDGSLTRHSKAKVTKLGFNVSFAESVFTPPPPPKFYVLVTKDGRLNEEYLIRSDGSKRSLNPAEREKDYDEVAKTNADGTPYVPAKK